jgi:hypothetical protein
MVAATFEHPGKWHQRAFEIARGPEIATMYRWFHDAGYAADISAVQQNPKLMSFDH